MSDTPRTDAEAGDVNAFERFTVYNGGTCVQVSFARQLERELAESQAQVVALREALESALPICDQDRDLTDEEIFAHCGDFYIRRRKALRRVQQALTHPAPPVMSNARYDELWQHAEKLSTWLSYYRKFLPNILCDSEDQWLATHEGKSVAQVLATHEALKQSK